jgi:hypothetical protein
MITGLWLPDIRRCHTAGWELCSCNGDVHGFIRLSKGSGINLEAGINAQHGFTTLWPP